MKIKIILLIFCMSGLGACNATVPEQPPQSGTKLSQNPNKTAQILSGKILTSSAIESRLDSIPYYSYYYWCQNSGHVGPDEYLKIKSGLCYTQTSLNRSIHLREFGSTKTALKLPKASSAELQQLKQDLIQMDFASIQSMSGKPDLNKGYWSALFCYEDPAKPKERAKCMEATNPLTHPKTDAVMQMLKRFARGNSMDPR